METERRVTIEWACSSCNKKGRITFPAKHHPLIHAIAPLIGHGEVSPNCKVHLTSDVFNTRYVSKPVQSTDDNEQKSAA